MLEDPAVPVGSDTLSRRRFGAALGIAALGNLPVLAKAQGDPPPKQPAPVEAAFERDYPTPGFKPSWKKPQLNRQMLQDFVIFAMSRS